MENGLRYFAQDLGNDWAADVLKPAHQDYQRRKSEIARRVASKAVAGKDGFITMLSTPADLPSKQVCQNELYKNFKTSSNE